MKAWLPIASAHTSSGTYCLPSPLPRGRNHCNHSRKGPCSHRANIQREGSKQHSAKRILSSELGVIRPPRAVEMPLSGGNEISLSCMKRTCQSCEALGRRNSKHQSSDIGSSWVYGRDSQKGSVEMGTGGGSEIRATKQVVWLAR